MEKKKKHFGVTRHGDWMKAIKNISFQLGDKKYYGYNVQHFIYIYTYIYIIIYYNIILYYIINYIIYYITLYYILYK